MMVLLTCWEMMGTSAGGGWFKGLGVSALLGVVSSSSLTNAKLNSSTGSSSIVAA